MRGVYVCVKYVLHLFEQVQYSRLYERVRARLSECHQWRDA